MAKTVKELFKQLPLRTRLNLKEEARRQGSVAFRTLVNSELKLYDNPGILIAGSIIFNDSRMGSDYWRAKAKQHGWLS